MKKFNLIPLFPCKTSWDLNRKLNLLNNNPTNIKPSYTNKGLWIKHFSHSNPFCARATCAITNHALIEEYQLRFFPREKFNCLCRLYSIKPRCYILHEYRRFNKYWNPMRDTISTFVSFLEFNLNAFSFRESIT